MQIFLIRPDGFEEIKPMLVTRTVIVMGVAYLAVFILPALVAGGPIDYLRMIIGLCIGIGLCIFSLTIALKKQRPIFQSVVVTVDSDKITFARLNTTTLTLSRTEITKITKLADGGFRISGRGTFSAINIPAQIENPQELETLLQTFSPIIVQKNKPITERFIFSIILIIPIALMYISNNPTVVMICMAIAIVVLAVSFVVIQLTRGVDKRTRMLSWFSLIPLISFSITFINKLLNG